MREIVVTDCNNNKHIESLYSVDDFPVVDYFRKAKIVKAKNNQYVDLVCAFDIEATTVKGEKPLAFMYQWQFCIEDSVCFGRTWEEFTALINKLHECVKYTPSVKWVVYVHNLAYEFQFMHPFMQITSLFARSKRSPLYVRTLSQIEFRCSYMLSNMSLEMLCKNTPGCVYWKKSGAQYDYEKIRTPNTPLSAFEEEYCYCDVRGLVQCIHGLMAQDNLATIPLTSTGFVRRDFREVMKQNSANAILFKKLQMNKDQYIMAKKAFRGGNTSSNTLYVDELLTGVDSFDLQSSYPAAMLCDKFPMTKFMKVTINSRQKFSRYIESKACLFTVAIDSVCIKDLHTIPYIARAKCDYASGARVANGRVLSADRLVITTTDIDWKIIESHYSMGNMVVIEMYIAEYDYLPLDFRKELLLYFRKKCELKVTIKELEKEGKEESEEYLNAVDLYNKFKNKINASYGMMVTDIATPDIVFDGEWKEEELDIDAALSKYYNNYNSFLSYQHGVWVTANARKRLQDMLDIVGSDTVYIDTDSIKCIGNHKAEFSAMNDLHRKKLENAGGLDCVVYVGAKVFYIGAWEYEETYAEFKTLGSKKYIYQSSNGAVHLTLAGVNKKKGGDYFAKLGGCDSFKNGVILKPEVCGRTVAYYNSEPIHKITICGDTFTTASNIGIVPTTYELGFTDGYPEIIAMVKATE